MDTKTEKLLIKLIRLVVDNTSASSDFTDVITALQDVELSVDENKATVILNTAALGILDAALGMEIIGSGVIRTITIAGGSGSIGLDIDIGSGVVEYDEAWDTGVETTIDNWLITHAANILANQGITATKASTSTILLTGSAGSGAWSFTDGSATMTATAGFASVIGLDAGTLAALTSLETQVDLTTTAVNTNKGAVDLVKAAVDFVKTAVDTNKSAVDLVKTAIDENKAKVILNTTAVTSNEAAVALVDAAVDLVRTAVDENKAKVILNTTQVDLVTTAVNTNKSAVDLVKTAVDENKAKVVLNTTAVDLVTTAVNTNKSAVDLVKTAVDENKAKVILNTTQVDLVTTAVNTNKTAVDLVKTAVDTNKSAVDLVKTAVDLVKTAVDQNKAQITQLISQSFGGAGFEIAGGVTTETLTIAGGSGTLGIDITSGSFALISYDEAWNTNVETTIDNWITSHAAAILAANGITATKASPSTILLTGSVPAGIWVFADGGTTMTATSGGQSTAMNTITNDCSVIEVVADAIFDVATTVGFGDVLPFGQSFTAGTKLVGNFTNIKLVSGVALCYVT